MLQGALDVASLIATKSPIAVQGTKVSLVFSRDHSVPEGLDHIVSGTLQTRSGAGSWGHLHIVFSIPTFMGWTH